MVEVFGEPDANLREVLISQVDLTEKVGQLGDQITRDYQGKSPLLVAVLKGAYPFLADLARCIDLPVEIDFMAVASYGSATKTSGVVRLVKDLEIDISNRDVIIVEDIVDSGLTLSFLQKNLMTRAPRSIEVCALLIKQGLQKTKLDIRYSGFTIPPDFVVGYGLDVDQKYRNLPMVCTYKSATGN